MAVVVAAAADSNAYGVETAARAQLLRRFDRPRRSR